MQNRLTALAVLVCTVGLSTAAKQTGNDGYTALTLLDDWQGSNFFDQFNFFTSYDPTHGFVRYVDRATAQARGLIRMNGKQVFMGSDNSTQSPGGRMSVRLESKKSYNSGLIIIDLEHMPTGCGTWPAFWTYGPNWPNSGEIDIIEGVHDSTNNTLTLHTGPRCNMVNVARRQSATIVSTNCIGSWDGRAGNEGCSNRATTGNTYGGALNTVRGGVYATHWDKSGIRIYHFPRSQIPRDITDNVPNPAAWGVPQADFPFGANCEADNFRNNNIIFDLTFCGDWAGQVWNGSPCAQQNPGLTCNQFVERNPSAFSQAYWIVNYVKVFSVGAPASSRPHADVI